MPRREAEWPSEQNTLICFVPLADTTSAEPSPESLHLGTSCSGKGTKHSENLHLIHKTTF